MVKILGIATALVLAVATLVALKNNSFFKEEIVNRDLSEKSLAKSRGGLADAQDILRSLPVKIEQVNSLAVEKAQEEVKEEEALAAYQESFEAKTAEIEAKKANLEIIREKAVSVGDIKNLAGKIKGMRLDIEELDQVITGKEVNLANLAAQTTSSQNEVDRHQKEIDLMSKGESLATLKTRVSRVYPTWGFVTLADGNNAGVIGGSSLNVLRGGRLIGKLLVTAVESSSASASIIPDSVGSGERIRVGDQVVPSVKLPKGITTAGN